MGGPFSCSKDGQHQRVRMIRRQKGARNSTGGRKSTSGAGPLGRGGKRDARFSAKKRKAKPAKKAIFEFVVEGIPLSGNNRNPEAREWRRHVADAAIEALPGWRVPRRNDPDISAVLMFFHTGPCAIDTDNIPKHVLDALKGIAYEDDRIIAQVTVRRTEQKGGFELINPPPLIVRHLGITPQFLYVKLCGPPRHEEMPD